MPFTGPPPSVVPVPQSAYGGPPVSPPPLPAMGLGPGMGPPTMPGPPPLQPPGGLAGMPPHQAQALLQQLATLTPAQIEQLPDDGKRQVLEILKQIKGS